MANQYSVCVKREIYVSVIIEADSEEEAIALYRLGEYDEDDEFIDDCTDISEPEVYPVEER